MADHIKRTPNDDDLQLEITWVRACDPIPEAFKGYHHDHDEELGMYWYDSPEKERLERPLPKDREPHADSELYDLNYWLKTGSLVREYLKLQAGAAYGDTLRQGLVTWLQASPVRRQQYEKGDDMRRAVLVDWYLKVVR